MRNVPNGLLSAGLSGILSLSTGYGVLAQTSSPVTQHQQTRAVDPGVRTSGDVGGSIKGLTSAEHAIFEAGRDAFREADGVGEGLGPRFNLDSCAGCHSQPAVGGSAPAVNPQVTIGTAYGARNKMPSFVRRDGPIVEARFKKNRDGSADGGVHGLFVISGRSDGTADASDCTAVQADFDAEFARNNVSLRIPTPVFGGGLIEAIADGTILTNRQADQARKANLGISGRPNRNPNTGTITKFGWKAQVQSLLMFAGEAYNVESGISNELFQAERDDNPTCQYASVPNDITALHHSANTGASGEINDIELFALFMKFLAPPEPSRDSPGGADSISRGRRLFESVGCALCHTPALQTSRYNATTALQKVTANLYSDLLVHNMGPGLADDIRQGQAGGDEFRTAPLWGLGQRIFFLHDGRTKDLRQAIKAHWSPGDLRYGPSEANRVVENFAALPESSKQDVLNFLRSL